ncbi:MAG: uracil-DNA glycosylase [Parachlamydiales bacterium]|nr:uracil-DNA glycosylase [Parachlamydiales bacterium]
MYMEKGWLEVLEEEFQKPYMKKLQSFLSEEIHKKNTVYPPEEMIFNALCQTPYSQVRVVIMGQDPYHGKGQAHGLSFSVPHHISPPPSLVNIFKELQKDLGVKISQSGSLMPWAAQGVLLLNATLTVRANEPNSHRGKGWEMFTDRIIELLAVGKKPLVFMLWGKSAQEKCLAVLNKEQNRKHLILTAAHPSPYSASNGFFGCRHFSQANDFLRKNNEEPINWALS